MRIKGKLISWDEQKGYGFIAPTTGGGNIFVHNSAFSNRTSIPKINDLISYTPTIGKAGKPCAKNAVLPQCRQLKSRKNFLSYFAYAFLLAILAMTLFSSLSIYVFSFYLILSALTYMMYAVDKAKAKAGKWRIKEQTLHLFSLCGGWPGAALAQQNLRHKSQKRTFKIGFWFTVIMNVSAVLTVLIMQDNPLLQPLIHYLA